MAHRTVTILLTAILALAVLLTSAAGVASAGSLDKALTALKEYQSTAPTDADGISQFRAAIYCIALARELRKASPGTDLGTYQNKCGKVGGVVIDNADMAEDEGLLDLTAGLISALVEVLKKVGP